ncbi:MAG: gasdermin [Mycobacteriaceae bacterium]
MDKYDAQLLAVPTTAIRPGVLLMHPGSLHAIGHLPDLLTGEPLHIKPLIETDIDADMASKKSRVTDSKVKVALLEGVLASLGLPTPMDLRLGFSRASSLVCSFKRVRYHHINRLRMDAELLERPINTRLASAQYLTTGHLCFLVDAVLASSDVHMSFEAHTKADAEMSIRAISEVVGAANAAVKRQSTTQLEVTFRSKSPKSELNFAYSVLAFLLNATTECIEYVDPVQYGIVTASVGTTDVSDPAHLRYYVPRPSLQAPHALVGKSPVFVEEDDAPRAGDIFVRERVEDGTRPELLPVTYGPWAASTHESIEDRINRDLGRTDGMSSHRKQRKRPKSSDGISPESSV